MQKMHRERFKELCGENGARLYVARIYNEDESFYKVGITSKECSYERLLGVPYDFRILQEVSHPDPHLIFDLEKYLISLGTRYTPKIPFGGHSECVESVDAILEYLSTLTWIEGLENEELKKVKRPGSPYIATSLNYIEALLKMKDSPDTKKKIIKSVEEDPRFHTLVEYVNIFGIDEYLLEGSRKKLAEYYLRKKISAYKDRQRLKEFLSYKYEVGDIITNKSLKQDLISAYNLLGLTGKPKLTDINLAYKTAPTSILVSGKKENAFKIVALSGSSA